MDKHNTIKLQAMAVLTLGAWLLTLKPALGLDLKNTSIEHLTDSRFDISIPSPNITQNNETIEPTGTNEPVQTPHPEVAVYTANKPTSTPKTDNINHAAVEIVHADARAVPQQTSPDEVRALIIKYAREYGVSSSKMLSIAQCESGLNPDAVNGSFGGIYQFLASTWQSNRQAMGLDDDPSLRFSVEEAVKTAAFKMSRDGFGAWPVCSTI